MIKTRRLREGNRRVRGAEGSALARAVADFPDRRGGQAEKLEEGLVCVRVALFEERVEALSLRVGDARFVQQGDELVLGDRFHRGVFIGCRRFVSRRKDQFAL